MLLISSSADELAILARDIVRLAPRGTISAPPRQAEAPTELHCFQRLPTEIRMMIWKEAAMPSYCPRYYRAIWPKDSPLPTSAFLPNRGVWKADGLAFQSMIEEYKKAKAIVKAPGYIEPKNEFGKHDRRLAKFIRRAFRLKVAMITKMGEFKRTFSEMDIPDTCCVMRHLFRIDIGEDGLWEFGLDRILTNDLFQEGWEIRPTKSIVIYMLEMRHAGNEDATKEDARAVARQEIETCDGIYNRSGTVTWTNP